MLEPGPPSSSLSSVKPQGLLGTTPEMGVGKVSLTHCPNQAASSSSLDPKFSEALFEGLFLSSLGCRETWHNHHLRSKLQTLAPLFLLLSKGPSVASIMFT